MLLRKAASTEVSGTTNGVTAARFPKSDYNFSISSEENYRDDNAPFVGKYAQQRSQLDYAYHRRYAVDRQLFHDELIEKFEKTIIYDGDLVCDHPTRNWIVFTAGAMGAGKGHTIEWLYRSGLFPLQAFVNVDPDAIRALLPEFELYNKRDELNSGKLTQKEVGYVSEVLTYNALMKKKNVLVDGSLRDTHWYLEYFNNLQTQFPKLRIAIVHVTAAPETVLVRALRRAKVTGRNVPQEIIIESIKSIPRSIATLSPYAHFYASFHNEDGEPEPMLTQSFLKDDENGISWKIKNKPFAEETSSSVENCEIIDTSDWKEVFREVWVMKCEMPSALSDWNDSKNENESEANDIVVVSTD